MKLNINYPTTERKQLSAVSYSHVRKDADLEPVRIIRTPCGTGAAANRYYYSGVFVAPEDAEYVIDGTIRANIFRKQNPHFNPKILNWVGNVAVIGGAK